MHAKLHTLAPALMAVCCMHTASAQNCFFSADFEDGSIPAGWTNTDVTAADGSTTAAWTVGTAAQADVNGYFPVTDLPIGNRFAMANDDAAPCDCSMDAVFLTTPVIDLGGSTAVALECRVFHEMALNGGAAWVEASTNGTDWSQVDSIEAMTGGWQDLFIDLGAFDGSAAFQLRFHWSDSGNWASGFAVDDVCFFERAQHDLRIVELVNHAITTDPFDQSVRSLSYRQIPLEQASSTTTMVRVQNRGTVALAENSAQAQVTTTLNGAITNVTDIPLSDALAPGETSSWVALVTMTPDQLGRWDFEVELTSTAGEDEPQDNRDTTSIWITGPGWDGGYNAMARDNGMTQGTVGSTSGFIAANRFEIANAGSTAHSVTAVLGVNSTVGEEVRAILMDGNFAFIDTSARYAITQADIDGAYGGLPIHLPFTLSTALLPGDYFVGLQRLSGSGYVEVATGGACATGASALLVGTTFDIQWLNATPMVRLHLGDYGVGLAELPVEEGALDIRPNPVHDNARVVVRTPYGGAAQLGLWDMTGRFVRSQPLGHLTAGTSTFELEAGDLPSGPYVLRVQFPTGTIVGRMVVAH